MSEREGELDRSGNEPADEASQSDEAALIREVVRMQERHREGGIDSDVVEDVTQAESEAPG